MSDGTVITVFSDRQGPTDANWSDGPVAPLT